MSRVRVLLFSRWADADRPSGPADAIYMATLLATVEATLLGKDARLVAKCNVPGILAVFERWDIYDVATLSANGPARAQGVT